MSDEKIGHYRILAELGEDELGAFIGAVDERLERMVVLRVSRPAVELGPAAPEVFARMREGARVASHLNHPNLVTVYEYLPIHDTVLVALEQVEGDTLEQQRLRGERWTVLDVARIVARVADALAAAHAEGLAHGRVNAANVKIRPDGRIKLLDLGLPREMGDDGHVLVPQPADDVRDLASLACELLAPPGAETVGWRALLSDAVRARASFGFLTPVLARVLHGPDGPDSMAAFRDAVLLALESAAGRSGAGAGAGVEPSFSTRVIGPAGSVADLLPEDSRSLAVLARIPVAGTRTRLVLPPDLAERVPAELQDLPAGMPEPRPRPSIPWRIRPAWLAAIVVLLASVTVALLWATRGGSASGAGATTPAIRDPAAAAASSDSPADRPTVAAEDTRPPGATEAAPLPVVTARVRVTPNDATIRLAGEPDSMWSDGDEVTVAAGDTLLLEFVRPGYVTERVPFAGDRVSVALVPDSVVATFEANVRADVYLVTGSGEARLGSTGSARRLPSGTYTFVFRSTGQADWRTTVAMRTAGRTYRVARTDYPTTGSLVATVSSSWALASLDGGAPKETPATWNDVPVGPHVLRLEREGFRIIVDTIIVPGGQTLRRQYVLQRRP